MAMKLERRIVTLPNEPQPRRQANQHRAMHIAPGKSIWTCRTQATHRMQRPSRHRNGFTLIELLVVIAIIAILAVIAVPNMLEAQTRSKASRARADMRTVALALELYQVDCNAYPYPLTKVYKGGFQLRNVFELTTPVAYLTSVDQEDIFKPGWDPDDGPEPPAWLSSYHYFNYSSNGLLGSKMNPIDHPFEGYCLLSVGPDRKLTGGFHWLPVFDARGYIGSEGIDSIYNPTNGTTSEGDIGRWTGHPTVYGAF